MSSIPPACACRAPLRGARDGSRRSGAATAAVLPSGSSRHGSHFEMTELPHHLSHSGAVEPRSQRIQQPLCSRRRQTNIPRQDADGVLESEGEPETRGQACSQRACCFNASQRSSSDSRSTVDKRFVSILPPGCGRDRGLTQCNSRFLRSAVAAAIFLRSDLIRDERHCWSSCIAPVTRTDHLDAPSCTPIQAIPDTCQEQFLKFLEMFSLFPRWAPMTREIMIPWRL